MRRKKFLISAAVFFAVWPLARISAAEPIAVELEEVVVTATRTENAVRDVPEAAEVFTENDFRRLGAQDVRSALRLAAGLDLSQSGMAGNFHAVSFRGMGSERTLVLVDGRRLAGEDASETANVYELERIPLSAVERIETVRSNASALYGSDALGGVINIITKKSGEAGLVVGANTGSHAMNQYYRYDFGEIGKFSGSFDANFGKLRRYSFTPGGNTPMYGPRQNFSFNGEYKISENRGIGVALGYMKDHLRMDYAEGRLAKEKFQTIDGTRKSAALDFHGKAAAGDFLIRAYYNRLEKDNETYNKIKLVSPALGRVPAVVPVTLSSHALFDNDRARYDTLVLEGRDTLRLSGAHRLTAGGEYRKLAYRGTRLNDGNKESASAGSAALKIPVEKELDLYALYLEEEWTPSEKWLIAASVRYDHSSRFGANTSPKIGMTYKIRDNLRVKANYGRGFRAPTLSELYLYFDGGSMANMPGAGLFYISGNPELEPEKSLGVDFRLEWEPGRAFGSVSYFRNRVDHLITAKELYGNGTFYRYANIGEAEMEGVEVAAGLHLNDRWTLEGTWNALKAEDAETGERLEGRASHYGTLRLRYDDRAWSGVLWYEFTDDFQGSGGTYGYDLLNFSVSRNWGGRVRAFAGLDNLTNKKSAEGIYLDGRLWRTGVEWKF